MALWYLVISRQLRQNSTLTATSRPSIEMVTVIWHQFQLVKPAALIAAHYFQYVQLNLETIKRSSLICSDGLTLIPVIFTLIDMVFGTNEEQVFLR